MRESLSATFLGVMIALTLSMVPALAQSALQDVTGRDWLWIIAVVALVARV